MPLGLTNTRKRKWKLSVDMFPCVPHPARPGSSRAECANTGWPQGGECVPREFKSLWSLLHPQCHRSFVTQPEGPRGSQVSTLCSPGAEGPGQWGTEPTGSSYSLCSLPKAVTHLAGLSLPVLRGQQTIPRALLRAQALSWWMRTPPRPQGAPPCVGNGFRHRHNPTPMG